MKIAFSSDEKRGLDSIMSHHFGKCPYYVIVVLDNQNNIVDVDNIDNPFAEAHGPGVVPEFISKKGINVMVSGGMGHKAMDFFKQFNVQVATGANGTVRESLADFLSGKLSNSSPCSGGKKSRNVG